MIAYSCQLINAHEMAELLGVSLRTVWRYHCEGRLPKAVRIKRTVRWRLIDIETWLDLDCPKDFESNQDIKRRTTDNIISKSTSSLSEEIDDVELDKILAGDKES